MMVMPAIRRQALLFSARPAFTHSVLACGSGPIRCASSLRASGGLAGLRMGTWIAQLAISSVGDTFAASLLAFGPTTMRPAGKL